MEESASDRIVNALLEYQISLNKFEDTEAYPTLIDDYIEIIRDEQELKQLKQRISDLIVCDTNHCPFIKSFQEISTPSEDHYYVTFMNNLHCNLPLVFLI